jgi:hypothetical protein
MDPEPRLKKLETLTQVAADTLMAIDDWLGNASTREAAEDSIRRLWRALQAVGFNAHVRDNLGWRGSLLRAMDRAGIGYGEDDEIRVRTPQDKPWMRATGLRVKDLLADLSELPRGVEGEETCPRCGREQLWIDAEVRTRLALTAGAGESAFEVVETELIDEIVWQRDQATSCPACGWKGTIGEVMDFLGAGSVSTFSALKGSCRTRAEKHSK